jgi:hypothetical protein
MSLLLYILVLALVFGLLFWAVGMLPLPSPFGTVVRVVLVLIFVFLLLRALPLWHDAGPVVVPDGPRPVVVR